jgi:hypothetical protein
VCIGIDQGDMGCDCVQHLFVTGTADRKILTYDTNTKEVVQEYDR